MRRCCASVCHRVVMGLCGPPTVFAVLCSRGEESSPTAVVVSLCMYLVSAPSIPLWFRHVIILWMMPVWWSVSSESFHPPHWGGRPARFAGGLSPEFSFDELQAFVTVDCSDLLNVFREEIGYWTTVDLKRTKLDTHKDAIFAF